MVYFLSEFNIPFFLHGIEFGLVWFFGNIMANLFAGKLSGAVLQDSFSLNFIRFTFSFEFTSFSLVLSF